MAKQSRSQKRTMERVMHEFKHGELESGRSGRKVKSRRQAVAIGLSESGSSKYQSERENERKLRRSKAKERKGETAMQEKEGKGALRKLDNSKRGPVRHRKAGRSKSTREEIRRVVPPAQA